jgi:hypothetical protein
MPQEKLVPVDGCFVLSHERPRVLGCVEDRRNENTLTPEVLVNWGGNDERWEPVSKIYSGFQKGWTVQDVPLSVRRKTRGVGKVAASREIGGRHQVLVQFEDDGKSIWFPYENLRRIMSVEMVFSRSETSHADSAERFRLRLLAHALENWNQLTGSLDRLDVDPLPHQIHLVHTILSSGNYNWLIADDVGLGKTIEVGLLLAAMKRKGNARRVLIVCPAGLVRQWQDEMKYKFEQTYLIYGLDFNISDPEQWKIFDHVIVSMDKAKHPNHIELFRQSGGWDIVAFDESHKLTRYASGKKADRYHLAEALRPLSDSFLLLSGTPHQGYQDRFVALLELVRPDLSRQVRGLEANPEIVSELILRNRKSEVTDADGNLIFKGQRVHRVPVPTSGATQEFQALLRKYLKEGYKIGESGGGQNRAIGFVMTTYRKLASSSIAAIERALHLRLQRLKDGATDQEQNYHLEEELDLTDIYEGGDDQDDLDQTAFRTPTGEFFSHECELLEELLTSGKRVRENDEKLRIFIDEVVSPLIKENKKLLIFTEYRGTQSYLQESLLNQFGGKEAVVLINGSMSLDEKMASIDDFNGDCRFLISTEAGGEGLNLQDSCHVMVNYDLPWNPARLAQRIGRLYRYGQKQVVIVINLHCQDSFDNAAISLMLTRVEQIAQDMSPVGDEYNDALYAEILGELLENLDLASILQSTTNMEIRRSTQQIEDALAKAQHTKALHDEIFSYVSGYDKGTIEGTIGFTLQHVHEFIVGMLPIQEIEISHKTHDGEVLDIRLPDHLVGKFPEFGNRSVAKVTASRSLAQKNKQIVLLDFETSFFEYLIEEAKSHDFGGKYACVRQAGGADGVLSAFKLRWQNDQGASVAEDFTVLFSDDDNNITKNPDFFSNWIMQAARSSNAVSQSPEYRRQVFQTLSQQAEAILGQESTRFKHPNGIVELAAGDFID